MTELHLERNVTTLLSGVAAGGAAVDIKTAAVRLVTDSDFKGIWLSVTGAAPSLTVTAQAAPDDVEAQYCNVPDAAPLLTISAAGPVMARMPRVSMALLRFRIEDGAGNGADTVVTLKLYRPDDQ